MQPRWSPSIPQAMQRHGGPPKAAPRPEKTKQGLQELDAPELATIDQPQNRTFEPVR